MKTALLLIAHGSRRAEANADLQHVAREMRATGEFAVVESAYLELAQPNIETGAAACAAHGVERVVLLPYFLSAGVHVQQDLTAMRTRLAERFPDVEFCLAQPLGRHPRLVDIVKDRAAEASRKSKVKSQQ
jgi:sirohydrochlorin ferrochelatase